MVHVQSGVHSGGGEPVRVGVARWKLELGRHHVPHEQKFRNAARVLQPLVPGGRRRQFQSPAAAQGLPQVAPRLRPRLSHRLHILRVWAIRNTVRGLLNNCVTLTCYFFYLNV